MLLPYLEQGPLSAQFEPNIKSKIPTIPAAALRASVPVYACPSRRSPGQQSTQFHATTGKNGSTGDYAAVDGNRTNDSYYRQTAAGGMIIVAKGTPTNWSSVTTLMSVTDGTSQTLMIGEKHVPRVAMGIDWDNTKGGDGPILGSYAYTIIRITGEEEIGGTPYPLARGPDDNAGGYASRVRELAHRGCNFVLGDGSVKMINNNIATRPLSQLTTRSAGTVIQEQW